MLGNWIRQTTASTGTGTITLAAVAGFPTFANQFSVGEYFYYTLLDDTAGTPIESGIGHLSDATTLVRDKILATFVAGTYSDNDPSAATLAAGTKRVICAMEQGASPINPMTINSSATSRVIYPAGVPTTSGAGTASLVADTVYYVPFRINTPRTIDGAMIRNTSTGVKARIGVYTMGLDGKPNLKIVESADIATSAAGLKTAALTKRRFKPGIYFVGIASAQSLTVNSCSSVVEPILGGDANMVGSLGVLWESLTSGWTSLPAVGGVTSGVFDISAAPLLALKLA